MHAGYAVGPTKNLISALRAEFSLKVSNPPNGVPFPFFDNTEARDVGKATPTQIMFFKRYRPASFRDVLINEVGILARLVGLEALRESRKGNASSR